MSAPIGAGGGIAGCENSAAGRRAAKQRVHGADEAHRGGEIGVEHPPPGLVGYLVRRPEHAERRGRGHKDVETPETLAERCKGALQVAGGGEVERAERGLPARRADRIVRLFQAADRAGEQHDMRARCGQPHRNRPAEPAGGARHERNRAGKRLRLRHGAA